MKKEPVKWLGIIEVQYRVAVSVYDWACLSVCAAENTAKAKVKTCFFVVVGRWSLSLCRCVVVVVSLCRCIFACFATAKLRVYFSK